VVTLYKLTDENGQSCEKTQWGPGVTHTASGKGELCGPGWISAYTHPLLAVLFNPVHADIVNPTLWRAEADNIAKSDRGLRVGVTSLTTIESLPLPVLGNNQRVAFVMLCALEVYEDLEFAKWANAQLDSFDQWRETEEEVWLATVAAVQTVWAAEEKPLDLIAIAEKAITYS